MNQDPEIIVNSFSTGNTSAFMSEQLKIWYPKAKILTVTANTGQEDKESIAFGLNVDEYLDLEAAVVEAVVHPEHNKGTTHKQVTWLTAYYGFDIWAAVIRKFGIFNIQYLHCTREMKERPIRSYLRSLGLRPRDYKIAVGIRADEAERVSVRNPQFIYPLLDRGITREDVLAGVADWPFKLNIPARAGNCRFCVKKSLRKLLINAGESPEDVDALDSMEALYGSVKQKIAERRVFFREKTTAIDLKERIAALGAPDPRFDTSEPETGCAEHCLPFVGSNVPALRKGAGVA